VHICISMYL